MGKGREVRTFDYVNQPYQRVRDVLVADAADVFRNATHAAASRAEGVVTGLKVDLGGLKIGADVDLEIREVEDATAPVSGRPIPSDVTRLHVEWSAARTPRLFPLMKGVLSAYALTATETQLEFSGEYEPPLGALGGVLDAVAGHRIAEASVHRFVTDIAAYLRSTLGGS